VEEHAGTRIVAATFQAAYAAAEPMLAAHHEEIGRFKQFALEPDLERYARLDDEGRLITLLATVDEKTVGYSCSIVQSNLHRKSLIFCQNDVLYVTPEHRKGRIGLLLIRETIHRAATLGAKLVLWHAKPDTALDELLPRMGYEIMDIIHAKAI
jgi:GNAT superfamily N-acetyltransferase